MTIEDFEREDMDEEVVKEGNLQAPKIALLTKRKVRKRIQLAKKAIQRFEFFRKYDPFRFGAVIINYSIPFLIVYNSDFNSRIYIGLLIDDENERINFVKQIL